MSLEVMVRVLRYSEATQGRRLVLLALAERANDDGTGCWPSVETLADATRMSRRATQSALRRLEDDGMIVSRGKSKVGTTIYDVILPQANPQVEIEGGEETAPRGAKFATSGGEDSTPEPSIEPSTTGGVRARASTRTVNQHELPPQLDAALHDTARLVLRRLTAIYDERGGSEPTLRGIGLTLARFPDRDHLRVVDDLEHWALAGLGQQRPIRDWSRTLATFLERTPVGKPSKASGRVSDGGLAERTARRRAIIEGRAA